MDDCPGVLESRANGYNTNGPLTWQQPLSAADATESANGGARPFICQNLHFNPVRPG